jgi:sporulation protein YlmC with PRC-barrel domain
MRLSEFLGTPVMDSAGEHIGNVSDVRLVQDGAPIGTFGAALRITGLVVSRGRIGGYLGYDRPGVRGPWLVATIVHWLHRHTVYVDWSDVATREPGRVTLARPRSELRRPEAPGGQARPGASAG